MKTKMQQVAPNLCSKSDVLDSLSYLMPEITPFWTLPLTEYARFVYDIPNYGDTGSDRMQAIHFFRIASSKQP
jgi:hypothetical protein